MSEGIDQRGRKDEERTKGEKVRKRERGNEDRRQSEGKGSVRH